MTRIEVDYVMDGSMERDVFEATGPAAFKISKSGRAYLRFDGRRLSYRRAERIQEIPLDGEAR